MQSSAVPISIVPVFFIIRSPDWQPHSRAPAIESTFARTGYILPKSASFIADSPADMRLTPGLSGFP
jgi:hypothetical protein